MELRQWVRGAVAGARDARSAWDAVWAALLDAVLRRGDAELPRATAFDLQRELAEHFSDARSQPCEDGEDAADAWRTNRGGPTEAFSELWARLTSQDGGSEWLHLSSRGSATHAEQQLVEAVMQRPNLKSVSVLANVSPCSDCAAALVGVSGRARLSLRFAALFAHHGDNHRQGLRQLAAAGAHLAVFGPRDWTTLAHRQVAERRHVEEESLKSEQHEITVSRKRPVSEDEKDVNQEPTAKRTHV